MNRNQVIIDVREPNEYASGHVDGAINIPPSALMSGAKALNNLDRDTKLIVYCKTGSRSSVAIELLKRIGFTNTINGINAGHVEKNYLNS
ncbi:MAG: rhodanese-like domain-containing protein [Candidatus Saccharimonadales bacterium]